MAEISFESEYLIVNWISFNLEGLVDPRIITGRLSKYFTPHILIDGVVEIAFHGFRKKYIISSNPQDQRVTGLELRLFSLVKMVVIFINFSNLGILIGVF